MAQVRKMITIPAEVISICLAINLFMFYRFLQLILADVVQVAMEVTPMIDTLIRFRIASKHIHVTCAPYAAVTPSHKLNGIYVRFM